MLYRVNKIQNNSHNCIVCGIDSGSSLKTRFLELDGGFLVGVPTVQYIHQSYPGRMHGGIITALLDETVGRAVQIEQPEVWGVTVRINVRFISPVPLSEQIYVIGRITSENRKFMEGESKIIHSITGQILATCEAKYLKLNVDEISTVDILHEDWLLDPREKIESIDLPIDLAEISAYADVKG